MNEFRTVAGFEEIWRAVGGRRVRPEPVLQPAAAGSGVRARLIRIVRRAPEVMVKVTGRIRSAGHLKAHLDYISRKGRLEVEGRDGPLVGERAELRDLATDWAAIDRTDRRRRTSSPLSLSIVLSMPRDTDPIALRDAAHAFASAVFGDRHEYALVLHTDAGHPHVHLAVTVLGADGVRLNPRKGDLQAWREAFAVALRDRGVEAEATPRRARGLTRKAERQALRRIGERHSQGKSPPARTVRSAYVEAAQTVSGGDGGRRPWESRIVARQARVRGLYAAQARLLRATGDSDDASLAAEIEKFVAAMPPPDTRRLALAREIRASRDLGRDASNAGRERSR